MKKVKFILIGSLLHCNAFAQLPSADSFVVSNIHFGDTQQDVRKIAIGAGLVLVTKGDFEPLGGFPTSLSYELYRKPCAICVNIPVDPRYESLEIQYSRLTTRVVAISKTLPFDKPMNRASMVQMIEDRFGKKHNGSVLASHSFSYAWRLNGRQEQRYEDDQHCGVTALPINAGKNDCRLAAEYSFELSKENSELLTSQSLIVIDWKTFDEEAEILQSAKANLVKKEVEASKIRGIPRP